MTAPVARETFATRSGTVLAMVGVAVGLGNVWRFPYMVGRFGGAAFVVVYLAAVVVVGIPALMTEWALGRETRRGTLGAFERGGLPFGRAVGWGLFCVVAAATAYYTNVVGWVLWHALAGPAIAAGLALDATAILPPADGLDVRSLLLQLGCSALVLLACVAVLRRGLRRGIERASKVIMPVLLVILLVLVARALTLPGAGAGLAWYILKFQVADLSPRVLVAALGQAVFSLSLGGTFMVVYGSYLREGEDLRRNAVWTAAGDTTAGLLAGLAIFPAVFALGLEPAAGPGFLFSTLPEVFARIPAGWLFGLLFFLGLGAAAFLSDIAALEVLIAGLADNTRLSRRRATWIMASLVLLLAVPAMLNMRVFTRWDLTFGSGMQTLGALLAVLTLGWAMDRGRALRALDAPRWLYLWVRWVIPAAIGLVGVWWLATEVL
jgi:NSS family neurotransmitter:Na+ symporter